MRPAELDPHEVEGVLRPIEQHDAARPEAGHLTRQLRSDRARAARDEDRLPGDVALHQIEVELDGLAPEEILQLHVSELPDFGALGEQVLQRRQDLTLDPGFGAAVDDAPQLRAVGGRNGDDQQLDVVVGRETAQVADSAEHPHAVQRPAVRVRVVVDQADDAQLASLVVGQLPEQLLAGFAGADDERAFPLRRPPLHEAARLTGDADREAEAPHQKDCEQPVEHQHGPRHASGMAGEPQDQEERGGAERDGGGHVDEIAHPHVPPVVPKQPEGLKRERPEDHEVGQRGYEVAHLDRRDGEVEAQRIRARVGERHEAGVERPGERPTIPVEAIQRAHREVHPSEQDAHDVRVPRAGRRGSQVHCAATRCGASRATRRAGRLMTACRICATCCCRRRATSRGYTACPEGRDPLALERGNASLGMKMVWCSAPTALAYRV